MDEIMKFPDGKYHGELLGLSMSRIGIRFGRKVPIFSWEFVILEALIDEQVISQEYTDKLYYWYMSLDPQAPTNDKGVNTDFARYESMLQMLGLPKSITPPTLVEQPDTPRDKRKFLNTYGLQAMPIIEFSLYTSRIKKDKQYPSFIKLLNRSELGEFTKWRIH